MPAYFVVELEVTNMEAMAPYREAVPATLAQYGGRFVTRGGATELIEGGPEPKRTVILEFADAAAVKRWYHSPEYQKILPIRLANSCQFDQPCLYRRRRGLAEPSLSLRAHGSTLRGPRTGSAKQSEWAGALPGR